MPYYGVMFLSGVGCLILQSTLFSHLMIAGVKPDLLLVLVLFNSFFRGPYQGACFGFFIGFLEDLYLGSFWGMNALAKASTAFLVGWLLKGAFWEKILIPVLALFLGSLFNGSLLFLMGKALGSNWDWGLFYWKIVPMAIYNTCLVPFIYTRFYYWVGEDTKEQSL